MKSILSLALLSLASATAGAYTTLNTVFVSAPAINCVFSPTCSEVVNDSTGPISLPGWPASPTFFLQTRTYPGQPGSPAAGLYAYEYRIDLTPAGQQTGPEDCLFAVTINFGPVVPMDFNGSGTNNDVYVVTEGGIGSVAPTTVIQDGSQITFLFAAEADTGLISQMCVGASSFFIGLVSAEPPTDSTALIDQPPDGGWAQYGIPPESVAARTPKANPFELILQATLVAETFPLATWAGESDPVRHIHRGLALNLLGDAHVLVGLGQPEDAADLLEVVLRNLRGPAAWVLCDPATGLDQATVLSDEVATALDYLNPQTPFSLTTPDPCSRPGQGSN